MHNKVVYHAMKALSGFGFPVLRFNFRGTGLSEGTHDEGRGERDDVRAALDWIEREYPKLPIIFAGFSFGAATGLKAACPDSRVVGVISLGTPVAVLDRAYQYNFLAKCSKPKLFVSGTNDRYGPVDALNNIVNTAADPKELVLVEGADHFFEEQLPKVRDAITSWVSRHFPAAVKQQRA
jgi:alpha/beta superfamily hydrolase